MKRHLRVSSTKVDEDDSGGANTSTSPTVNEVAEHPAARAASTRPHLALASVRSWRHTVVLGGELQAHAATDLESEIERLCEEGVTSISLDLRKVTYLDPIVVAVIAFRCGLCKRRGFDFAVIRGPRAVQRAFEQAGVADLLPFLEQEIPASDGPIEAPDFEAQGAVQARRAGECEPATDADSHAAVR